MMVTCLKWFVEFYFRILCYENNSDLISYFQTRAEQGPVDHTTIRHDQQPEESGSDGEDEAIYREYMERMKQQQLAREQANYSSDEYTSDSDQETRLRYFRKFSPGNCPVNKAVNNTTQIFQLQASELHANVQSAHCKNMHVFCRFLILLGNYFCVSVLWQCTAVIASFV